MHRVDTHGRGPRACLRGDARGETISDMRAPLFVFVFAAAACSVRVQGDDESTGASTGMQSDADPSSPGDATGPTTGGGDNPAGPCSPAEPSADACPGGYICCSDDPATTQGKVPNYFVPDQVDATYGVPIFSGDNNALSYSGQCVDVGDFSSPFSSGCPVPCDPTWKPDRLQQICGVGTVCCPFQQVDPERDCVLDPTTSRWRAVHGTDIPELTVWGGAHTTNQDPSGTSCALFAEQSPGPIKDVREDCFEQLTVADRRGFCYQDCPCYEDLCDMKNPDWTPRCG